jgi:hypothetical protein
MGGAVLSEPLVAHPAEVCSIRFRPYPQAEDAGD